MRTMLPVRLSRLFALLAVVALPLTCAGPLVFAQAPEAPQGPGFGETTIEPDTGQKQRKADPKQAQPQPQQKSATPALKTLPVPKTPAEREKALNDLYALLATSDSDEGAKAIADGIERIWLSSGSDTIDVLMERASAAIAKNNIPLAIKLLDRVVELAPDYPEAWNRRAYAHYKNEDVERSLGDLRRTLALDPHHFKALDGLSQILRELGQNKGALAALRQLLDVHPFWPGAKQAAEELEREVEGQGI